MTQLWYALHSHPRKEAALYRQATAAGIETYYPYIPSHPVNPRASKIKSYFPGYLFVRVNLIEVGMAIFQYMPNASGLVSFGGEPAVVPDSLIRAIRQRVDEIYEQGGEIYATLKSGDPVIIQSGPFAQYQAVFDDRISGTARVRVLLKMLNDRILPLELDEGQIDR
jgi:transcription antitermination factor NusG